MGSTPRRHRTGRTWGLSLVLLTFMACSDAGGGCSGCDGIAPVPYPAAPLPGGELQNNVVRARLTQGTLDFLGKNIEPLLAQFLVIEGRQARFVFPPNLLPAGSPLYLGTGSYIAFDLDNLQSGIQLTWLDADAQGRPGLRFTIRDADLYLDVFFATVVEFFPNSACRIQSDTGGLPAITVTELSFDMRIDVNDTGSLPQLSAAPENILIDLSHASEQAVLAMDIAPCDGTGGHATFCDELTPEDFPGHPGAPSAPICTDPGANCPEVCGLVDLFAQLGGFLVTILEPVLNELGPTLAGFISDALVEVLAAIPLGIETELDLLGLLGPVFANSQGLNIKVAASPDVSVAGAALGRGLDVGLSGGVTTSAVSPCATAAPPPDLAKLHGPAPDFGGWVEVDNPFGDGHVLERYHLGATISQALLNQATWSMFQSGMLCFNLGAEDIEELAGGMFSFTAGLLQTFDANLAGLTHPKAPMLASLRATQPPSLRLGAGGLVSTGVTDPLLEVAVNDLELGLFMLIDDTQQRVSGLKADLILELGINRLPSGAMEIAVEDLNLTDISQIYNELVPLSDLSALFELVVDLAVDTLLGDSLKFELDINDTISEALGGVPLELRINTVRRDFGPTNTPYLSLYATLCSEADTKNERNRTCYIPEGATSGRSAAGAHHAWLSRDASLYVKGDPRFPGARWRGAPSGVAEIGVRSEGPASQGYVYKYRVDGGSWSTFRPAADGVLYVKSARLKSAGHHVVEIQAQDAVQPHFTSEVFTVPLWVDHERPLVRAVRVGSIVEVEVEELVSPQQVEIFTRQHVNGQPVGELTLASHPINVSGLSGELEIVARDAAGNLSAPAWVELPGVAAATPLPISPEPLANAGCSASGGSAAWACLLGAALLLRRRRRG